MTFAYFQKKLTAPGQIVEPSYVHSSASGTINLDMNNGAVQRVELSGNVTFGDTITNISDGAEYTFIFVQDGSGGHTVSFGSGFWFPGGSSIVVSAAANAVDIVRGRVGTTGGTTKILASQTANFSLPASVVAENDINHWWKMNTGNTTGTDVGLASVTRRNLTFTSVTTDSNGNRTSSEDCNVFNGSSAFGVTATGAETTTVMSVASYSFWIKPSGTPGEWDTIFMCMETSGWKRGIGCAYTGGDLRFWAGDGTASPYSNTYSSSAYPSTGSWAHVACVLDYASGVRKIYINGSEGTKTGGDVEPTQTGSGHVFSVGSSSHATGNANYFWPGNISDFRIYDIALSASQVASIYAGDWP